MMSGIGSGSGSGRSRFPFTASQWQELEHQALVFKYMVSGMPIPPDLLFTIRRSLDSSLSSKFLIHQPQHIGWNSFHMGFGRKIDPEPGRCRRTDGKKWRCSKEAYPDSKYCERHMHRGRNRSRKPVEILSTAAAAASPPPNALHINNSRNAHPPSSSSSSSSTTPISYLTSAESHFLYPHHFPSSRPQESTNFFLPPPKDCSRHGMKGDSDEHAFFSSESKSNSNSNSNSNSYSSSKLEPLKMEIEHNAYHSDLQSYDDHSYRRYYSGMDRAEEQQPKKVMHHFLDEWAPKDTESWNNTEDKMPTHRTQLSISVPNSLHDFFITQKW